jgi:putative ABC transport system permease protein
MRALLAVSPAGLPRIGDDGSAIGMDWRVLGFTLGVSLLTGILFGLFPAFSASRSDLNCTLKESGSRSGTGFRQGKARSLLVVSEVSSSPGTADRRGAAHPHLHRPPRGGSGLRFAQCSDHGDVAQRPALPEHGRPRSALADGRDRLNALPGVEIAAAGLLAAHRCRRWHGGFQIVGRPVEKDCCGSKWMSITPGYLSLFKIPVLRGRDFTEETTPTRPL